MRAFLWILFGFFLISGQSRAFQAREGQLSGTVMDPDGQALPGALVYLNGTDFRTITNEQGSFEMMVPQGNYTLMVSYLGMETYRASIQIPVSIPLDITLHASEQELGAVEVVSTGYQELPKERATGSFVQLDSQLVQRRVSANLIDRLEDVTPGLVFNRGVYARNEPITIRGRSTINSDTSPLIIVDNFPYDGPLENINPNDVASITVLKDAAAASIWGARAGNGVIVITTVKGKADRPMSVSLNSNMTIGEFRDLNYMPRMANSDFIEIEKDLFGRGFYRSTENNANKPKLSPAVETLIALRDNKITPQEAEAQLALYGNSDLRQQITDYYLQPSLHQQHALSITGGSEAHAYQVSLGYDHNRADLIGNSSNRWTLGVGDQWKGLKNKLEMGLSLNLANQNSLIQTDIPTGYVYDRIVDQNGNPLSIAGNYSSRYVSSMANSGLLDWNYIPLNEIGELDRRTQAYDLRINPSFQYAITADIKLGLFYQYWRNLKTSRNRDPLQVYSTRDMINKFTQRAEDGSLRTPLPVGDILDVSQSDTYSHTFRPQLTYEKEWNGKHRLNALGGFEFRDLQGLDWSSRYYGYQDNMGISIPVDFATIYPLFYNPGQRSAIPSGISHGGRVDRFVSYYANLAYGLQNRYFLNLSARKDQSNIFGVETNLRGVPLWSMGGAWIISDEQFARESGMPFLKLRLTHGYAGNVNKNISSLLTAQYLTVFPTDLLPQVRSASILNPPNSRLRWEKVRTTNLGLDFETQNGFLGGSLEFFQKDSRDLIGEYSLPAATGQRSLTGNFASSQVKGADITLFANWLSGDFRWTSHLIYSSIKEKVTDFEKIPTVANLLSIASTSMPYPVVGRPLYGIYSYSWAGLDPQTGDPMGYLNGEPSSNYLEMFRAATIDNLRYHGSARPTTFGALRNEVSLKGFRLSVNISYRFGYYYRRSSIDYYSLLRGLPGHGDYQYRWRESGDEKTTFVPSLPTSSNLRRNDFYTHASVLVEKGDHIRLNDIRFSYTLSRKQHKGLPFDSVEFYSYANNLGIIWKASDDPLDPDFQTARPLKSISFGFRMDF
ncbi:SusC/RagA family TonB-linked outer membrane protein [Algoriphagus sp. CAU 1675]|uniref:SusC/RagA family TonB-linked outer membrane protein n=1 Tax=Algoriphagus sp. CAU 1675 TaxID=3032597 RepID=UPI0023DCE1BF|nr:SusC/RagA family TonB-linked outer membrane protein [Algoriphagus sp. CAU 1675]MDF2159382.1 SusC/RagA family TonB-linked outer membrane protein [Algoriphagus sp. CAU 1675]